MCCLQRLSMPVVGFVGRKNFPPLWFSTVGLWFKNGISKTQKPMAIIYKVLLDAAVLLHLCYMHVTCYWRVKIFRHSDVGYEVSLLCFLGMIASGETIYLTWVSGVFIPACKVRAVGDYLAQIRELRKKKCSATFRNSTNIIMFLYN